MQTLPGNQPLDEPSLWAAFLYESQCFPATLAWNFNDLMTLHAMGWQLLLLDQLAETCDDQCSQNNQ